MIISSQVYGQGSAADCRKNVQTLNMMRGDKEKQMYYILHNEHVHVINGAY